VISTIPSFAVFSSQAIPAKGSLSAVLAAAVFGSDNLRIVPIAIPATSATVYLLNSVGVSIHTASLT